MGVLNLIKGRDSALIILSHRRCAINLAFYIVQKFHDPMFERAGCVQDTNEPIQVGMYVQQRFRSDCASAQSDKSLNFPPTETLDP